MIINNLLTSSNSFLNLKKNLKKFYQNSDFYDKKISKIKDTTFDYKPSPYLLSSIVKYQKKKYKIEDFALDTIWQNTLGLEDYEKLNNFFWFFSLELKSSKKLHNLLSITGLITTIAIIKKVGILILHSKE